MDNLPPLQTTALDSSPASLPARRPSRKKYPATRTQAHAVPQPSFSLAEKYSDSPICPSNPFKDMPQTPPPQLSIADLEAQSNEHYKPTPAKKGRICMVILCIIVVWSLFMFGVVMFTNTEFPRALEWTKMKMEMVGTEKAVEALRWKVGEMMRYVDGLRLTEGVKGEERPGGNWTMGGLTGNGIGFGGPGEVDGM